jgi:hypothetical protein
MVTALFVHTFLNFILEVVSNAVNKISGATTTAATVEHSVEAFVGNLLSGLFSFFKKL